MSPENKPNPEQENLQSPIERMSAALPLSEVWSERETPQGKEYHYLYKQLQPADVAEIAQTLADPLVSLDLDRLSILLEQRYQGAGQPKKNDQIKDKNAWDDYIKLVNDILNFVTTARYRNVVVNGLTIRQHPTQIVDAVMNDEQRQLPLEQRWGLQHNIEQTILSGQVEQIKELQPLAKSVQALLSQSSRADNLEHDQAYLKEKFELERKYLRLVYGL